MLTVLMDQGDGCCRRMLEGQWLCQCLNKTMWRLASTDSSHGIISLQPAALLTAFTHSELLSKLSRSSQTLQAALSMKPTQCFESFAVISTVFSQHSDSTSKATLCSSIGSSSSVQVLLWDSYATHTPSGSTCLLLFLPHLQLLPPMKSWNSPT